MRAREGHSWHAVKKSHISLWVGPLIFSHSPIKAWQAAPALLFLTLPCPINLISEAFWFAVETGLGNRTGRSCQSIQLIHPVWSAVSVSPGDHTVQITCVVFDLSCSKYLSLLCLWRAYFEAEYIWAQCLPTSLPSHCLLCALWVKTGKVFLFHCKTTSR